MAANIRKRHAASREELEWASSFHIAEVLMFQRAMPSVPTVKKAKRVAPNESRQRVELGRYIVADSEICHGQPTFKGTRIMVWQVLDDVADGRSWEFICNVRWGGRIPLGAVAEAVRLAKEARLEPDDSRARRTLRRDSPQAVA